VVGFGLSQSAQILQAAAAAGIALEKLPMGGCPQNLQQQQQQQRTCVMVDEQ
jgi:hypothetical protein